MHNIASPDDFFPAFAFWYIVESSMACYISFIYFMYHLMIDAMNGYLTLLTVQSLSIL
jgi:hypothetical protein